MGPGSGAPQKILEFPNPIFLRTRTAFSARILRKDPTSFALENPSIVHLKLRKRRAPRVRNPQQNNELGHRGTRSSYRTDKVRFFRKHSNSFISYPRQICRRPFSTLSILTFSVFSTFLQRFENIFGKGYQRARPTPAAWIPAISLEACARFTIQSVATPRSRQGASSTGTRSTPPSASKARP